MINFKSIIIYDIETTSLPTLDHKTTRIIELSFLACEIEHLKNSSNFPRVLHKLVLCLNPNKMIHPNASETSGLYNEMLENLQPFRVEDFEILRHFISRLPPPQVIVAHNGNNFDFPILRRVLEKLNCNLLNDVYCADSLIAFRELLPKKNSWFKVENPQQKELKPGEITPKSQKTIPKNSLNYKQRKENEVQKLISPELIRELFPELSDCKSIKHKIKESFPCQNFSYYEPKSHKLKDIYYFLHKKNFPDCHRAEEDCKALLSCIIKCTEFLIWLNQNAVSFNSISPLF